MIIMRHTDINRNELHVDRHGVYILLLRPKVGGGWYTREMLSVPWPKPRFWIMK